MYNYTNNTHDDTLQIKWSDKGHNRMKGGQYYRVLFHHCNFPVCLCRPTVHIRHNNM